MKLIGFAQLRNEKEKGNLENWFACMNALCDKIYIYDQNSTDGSQEYYKQFDHVKVIESATNDFSREISCKADLLELVKEENEEGDWIFWLDGDTLIERRSVENPQGLKDCLKASRYEALAVGHYNLWRSDLYYRIDDSFHNLHGRVIAFWKLTKNISFPRTEGLHCPQYPNGIQSVGKLNVDLIHRGFSTDYQLITRYDIYKARGQSGWALDRMLNEKGLTVEKLDPTKIPEFAPKEDIHPSTLRPLIEIYNESK